MSTEREPFTILSTTELPNGETLYRVGRWGPRYLVQCEQIDADNLVRALNESDIP